MFKDIQATLKFYNANSRDSWVGDCVVRAISLALGERYDETRAQLNKIKRDYNSSAYNISPIYEKYLYSKNVGQRVRDIVNDQITVSQFCELYPTGTYLLLVDSSKRRTPDQKKTGADHMCCVIDGDVYDSWDSTNAIVTAYYKVPTTPTIVEDVDISSIEDAISDAENSYVAKMSAKYADTAAFDFVTFRRTDRYTGYVYLKCYINQEVVEAINSKYLTSEFGHRITIKISPTFTEADLPRVLKSLYQKTYDWCYNNVKLLRDRISAKSVQVNRYYRGDKIKLLQLPEWSRSLVTYYKNDGNPSYEDRYKVFMDALPDDPRINESDEVTFYADTLTELKQDMEQYRESYARFGYDY